MAYQDGAGIGVLNHYGPRDTGSAEGVYNTSGGKNQAVIVFDGEDFPLRQYVPDDSLIINIVTAFATGAITSATVGETDISAAAPGAEVAVAEGGELVVEGPTSGYVIVEYWRTAAGQVNTPVA